MFHTKTVAKSIGEIVSQCSNPKKFRYAFNKFARNSSDIFHKVEFIDFPKEKTLNNVVLIVKKRKKAKKQITKEIKWDVHTWDVGRF